MVDYYDQPFVAEEKKENKPRITLMFEPIWTTGYFVKTDK